MKVLFVSSGNSKWGIGLNVYKQGEALKQLGIVVDYYTIKGKGWRGYLKNMKPLRKYLKENRYDVVHAHYSLSAFLASIAGAKNMVVSLMGDDINKRNVYSQMIPFFNFFFHWRILIVKSKKMKDILGVKNAEILPNGVDIDCFSYLDKNQSREQLGWSLHKKHVLFAAIPTVKSKNYSLAEEALKLLQDPAVVLHSLDETPPGLMPVLYNASDVILLTSSSEGSPNVIKEAMASGRPVVCTDVGDIRWLFGEVDGHYITSFCAKDVAYNINKALLYSGQHLRTYGRERILELRLDKLSVSRRLAGLYISVPK